VVITIRTDKPKAEIGLYDQSGKQLSYHTWQAHRELSSTILRVVHNELAKQQADFKDISGVIVFRGPGSFTGLRIGVTVANTLAYGLQQPIVGTSGNDWQAEGLDLLSKGTNHQLVLPAYGAEAHITPPRR